MNSACENCRRSGDKLMLKGERCVGGKCAMIKRAYNPGSHGQTSTRSSKKSEYGHQLQEKQKARQIYGIRERQFRGYIQKAEKMAGNSAENLLRLLELRLDNAVYRLGLAVSRAQARQLVSHGLIKVNNKKVNIPSYLLKEGDIIEPKKREKVGEISSHGSPAWIELDAKKVSGKILHLPIREEIDTPVNDNLIIEFYSR